MAERRERCTGRTVLRYALLQIPGLALFILVLALLRRWLDLSPLFFWGLVGLWAAKDIALFPFVWRSYTPGAGGAGGSLMGVTGVAQERLAPGGYVRLRGELWRARLEAPGARVEKGSTVRVRAVEGLEVIVEPAEKGPCGRPARAP